MYTNNITLNYENPSDTGNEIRLPLTRCLFGIVIKDISSTVRQTSKTKIKTKKPPKTKQVKYKFGKQEISLIICRWI